MGEAGRLLLAVVDVRTPRDRIGELVERADLTALLEVARTHRVVGVLHQRLIDAGVDLPQPVAAQLERERVGAAAMQLASYQTLAAIARALDHPFLVVKGPVLGAAWYGDPSLRRFSDVDVLVRRSDFADVIDALLATGFRERSANWEGFLDHQVAEIPLTLDGTTLDLHWDLVALGTTRRELTWDMAPLFDRAEAVGLAPNMDVDTLDPADTLLHLCINGGLDGARRLGKLVDIDVVARHGRLDWSDLAARARAAGAGGLCTAVLRRCNHMIGTPVPSGLLAELEPFRGWLRLNAFVDRQRLHGRGAGVAVGVAPGALLASGRATRQATLGRFVRTLGSNALSRMGRPHIADTGGALDWQRTFGTRRRRKRHRRRYLRWVTTG